MIKKVGPTDIQDKHKASCHCGAVELELSLPDGIVDPRRCDCSICRRRNALMVKVPEGRFRLLAGADALAEYRFHTRTARHHFCKVCGIYPFHRKRVTPDHYGVNVHCLDGFDPAGIPVRRTAGASMP